MWVLFSLDEQAAEKFSGCISETVMFRKLILGRNIGWVYTVLVHSVMVLSSFIMIFDLAVETLSLKIVSGLYLRKCKG